MKLILFLSIILLNCCAHSSKYEPLNSDEAYFFNKSERNINFDEIKMNCRNYIKKSIAWTGIIKTAEIIESKQDKNTVEVILDIEHRNFDWIKDTYQKENYWLDKETKGKFRAVMLFANILDKSKRQEFIEYNKKKYGPGEMFIGYGNPNCFEGDNEIYFFPTYTRIISKGRYLIGHPEF
jgi:hypothetical protein